MAMIHRCTAIARRMISTYQMPTPATMFTPTTMSMSMSMPLSSASEPIVCGRGDKKTKRGKRFKGSFGNARPKRKEMIQRIKDKVEVPRSTPWPLPFKLV
ncbi:hypothetical protein Nepgr_025441 [Nepenthes gracilis]|uniref:30S ribosomal protein S31, mitochondrial n=1 Tax=Nepenthes gracilis TaxID=150966 RepID=A0AAD3T4T3_NEPGR|nr:hypothetical protein Nepgr_025441 [Nepenthes gracilis]